MRKDHRFDARRIETSASIFSAIRIHPGIVPTGLGLADWEPSSFGRTLEFAVSTVGKERRVTTGCTCGCWTMVAGDCALPGWYLDNDERQRRVVTDD
nr:hypothetical protein Iba_chr11fCG12710 [Ipomoea batatas]